MDPPTLAELSALASAAEEPSLTVASQPRFGRIDPLGIRQINFDLMDEVLPGLNNVARHIRPFVVISWAWRRAKQLAEARRTTHVGLGELLDFVDRIEVLYAISQFLRDGDADLPGNQALASWVSRDEIEFGGREWQRLRESRRGTTALAAAVNYGPGLRQLGWATPHAEHPDVMVPTEASVPALDAFESEIKDLLHHDAFSTLARVRVSREEVREWADAWALDRPTEPERLVMRDLLFGHSAPRARRLAGELMLDAAKHVGSTDADAVRAAMCGAPSAFEARTHLVDIQRAWRRLQTRQLFRLALEAMFHWTLQHLSAGPRSIDSIVFTFLRLIGPRSNVGTAQDWLASFTPTTSGPTELMADIEDALSEGNHGALAAGIMTGIGFCLQETSNDTVRAERRERLPLVRAKEETDARRGGSIAALVRHVLESWVIAQHGFWAVGRGLADARGGGRLLLRLRLVLDENGWGLTPGASLGGRPRPTGDRLRTALSLADECGLIS